MRGGAARVQNRASGHNHQVSPLVRMRGDGERIQHPNGLDRVKGAHAADDTVNASWAIEVIEHWTPSITLGFGDTSQEMLLAGARWGLTSNPARAQNGWWSGDDRAVRALVPDNALKWRATPSSDSAEVI